MLRLLLNIGSSVACGVIGLSIAAWGSQPSAEIDLSTDAPLNANANRCLLWIWVRASGFIQAVQVIQSSGATRLDDACARGVIDRQMIPGMVNSEPADLWTPISIRWKLTPTKNLPKQPNVSTPIPKLSAKQALNLGAAYYPPNALRQRKEGICEVHVEVSERGQVEALALTQSTGDVELDRGCTDAIYAAQFDPAKKDSKNVRSSTDVWLAWKLPN